MKTVYFGDLECGSEFEFEYETWKKVDDSSARGEIRGRVFFHKVCKVKTSNLSKAFVRGWKDYWFGMGTRGVDF